MQGCTAGSEVAKPRPHWLLVHALAESGQLLLQCKGLCWPALGETRMRLRP